ncbi:hypothetical protein [Mucilaginibacter pineti]|nr:hypothetical protein [Mucilaginibacter pineti]
MNTNENKPKACASNHQFLTKSLIAQVPRNRGRFAAGSLDQNQLLRGQQLNHIR